MTVSFIHHGDPTWASYRYRAAMPAAVLGARLNDLTADVLVFSKPTPGDVQIAQQAHARGQCVVVDYCDDHFDRLEYRALLPFAAAVTVPTVVMGRVVQRHRAEVPIRVIPEPYELPEVAPHAERAWRLWFGHRMNAAGYHRAAAQLAAAGERLVAVSNFPGAIPWSLPTLQAACAEAGIVVLPASAVYKSANRAIEAIRQGCFVVAEPHPALVALPGLWVGADLLEGVRWVQAHLALANRRLGQLQALIRGRYSPATIGNLWAQTLQAVAA